MTRLAGIPTLTCALAFLVAPGAGASLGQGVGDPNAPGAVSIEWRPTWEETVAATAAAWEKQLASTTRPEREKLLQARRMQLLDALIEKFPQEPQRRLEAYRELADHYFRIPSRVARGAQYSRKMIDEYPGRPDVAAWALKPIVWSMSAFREEEKAFWIEFAARRLTALYRVGYLSSADKELISSLKELFSIKLRGTLFMEAEEVLRTLSELNRKDVSLRILWANLCSSVGHMEPALEAYHEAAGGSKERDVHERFKWLMVNRALSGAQFPAPRDLELVWKSFLEAAPEDLPRKADALLAEDSQGRSLLSCSPALHCSLWASTDRRLLSLKAEELLPLRALQAEKVKELLETGRGFRALDDPLQVFRRYPFAAAAHDALMDLGELLLRRGFPGSAERIFREVLCHSADPSTREAAQVGLWLALAQQPENRDAFEAAFAGVNPDAAYPWMGGKSSAKAIRQRLLVGLDRAGEASQGAPPLARLRRQAVTVRKALPWPPRELEGVPPELLPFVTSFEPQVQGGAGKPPADFGLLLGAPDLLVCFGADLTKPLWTRFPAPMSLPEPPPQRAEEPCRVIPGVFQPATVGGRVFSRWGLDPSARFMTGVAAFDSASGEMLWSTLGDPDWEDLWPVSDPTVAEGRVYVLAVRGGTTPAEPTVSAYLLCLDAQGGSVLWRSHLADVQPALRFATGSGWQDERVDMFHHGSAVTVRQGEVYCLTNMGLVARCDARDGVIDWVREYPQARLRREFATFLNRRGAPPIVSGQRVLFVPRDYHGVFALDRGSGEMLWESLFVASDEVLGLSEGLLLSCDNQYLAATDIASGQTRWYRRFPDRIACLPVLYGGTIHVGGGTGLVRVAARTGEILEQAGAEKVEAGASLIVRPDAILHVPRPTMITGPSPIGEPFNARAPGKAPPLELPVRPTWRLPRANPRMFLPPSPAKASDRVYLMAQDALECIHATPQGGVLWRWEMSSEFLGLEWAEDAILLIYPRRVDAIDASSGILRWQAGLPVSVSSWQMVAGRLILADFHEDPRLAAMDAASGRVLWDRGLPGWKRAFETDRFGWDGKFLHLFGYRPTGGRGYHDLVCDLADGSIAASIALPPPKLEKDDDTVTLSLDGASGCYLLPSKALYWLSLDGAKTQAKYHADASIRQFKEFRVTSSWLQAVDYDRHERRATQWIYRREDPSYRLVRPAGGIVRGDRLFETDDRTLRVIDLPSKAEAVRYVIPVMSWRQNPVSILDFWQDANTVYAVSGIESWTGGKTRPGQIRLDAFDGASAEHRVGQVLPGFTSWRGVQVARSGGVLLLADEDGLHAYVSAAGEPKPPEGPAKAVYRNPNPITLDGSLAEWGRTAVLPLTGRGGCEGELFVTRDAVNLYVGVSYGDTKVMPRLGRGRFGAGDWLEVALSGNRGSFRWAVGVDERGGLVWEDLGAALPGRRQGRIAYDLAAQRHTYEIAIPLRAFIRQDNPGWQHVGLSIAVWDDRPGQGAACVLTLGDSDGEGGAGQARQALYLHSLSPEEEQAGLAIVKALADLKESAEFLEVLERAHAGTPDAVKGFYRDFLKANPTGAPAERALQKLDLRLRRTVGDDPGGEILKLAEEAGVAQEVRSRYASMAGAYVSQWVYVDPDNRPGMLMLQLQDANGWEHRVSWGEFQWTWLGTPGTPSRRIVSRMPAGGAWCELRVPLTWLGIHDRPIHGISFSQQGGGRVLWGRTAVVTGGKEEVVMDGSPREGRTRGYWEWADQPKRGQAKVHAGILPLGPDDGVEHAAFDFKTPVVAHVPPPLPRAAPQQTDAVALLERQIPKLGATEESKRFFDALLRLEASDLDKRIARCKWFLKMFPDHPQAADMLGELLEALGEFVPDDPVAAVDAIIEECRLPHATRYAFHRRFTHPDYRFLRDWQVIGPFKSPKGMGMKTAYPPEAKRVVLGEQYQGVRGTVGWQLYRSETDYVNLANVMAETGECAAYAACWVHSEKGRPAVIEIGADAACKVWLNGRFLQAAVSPDKAAPGDDRVRCYLSAGWNEILVKVVQEAEDWGFFLELVDPDGRGPLADVLTTAKPPP